MEIIDYLHRLAHQKKSSAFDEFLANYQQIKGCPVTATMQVVGGKWKPAILYSIDRDVNRFGELLRIIENISKKVLTDQLRELEKDGILVRTVFDQRPARVEYSLTELGTTLMPIIEVMCDWGLRRSTGFKRNTDSNTRTDE